MSNVIEVNGSLSKWVNSTENKLVVIDFFATWCGPCRMIHPIYDDLSRKYPNVIFLRVDSDKNRELSGQYSVSALPTFIFVFHGEEVDRIQGADSNALESKIQQYGSSAMTFKGTGMSLGGGGVRDAQSVREMRLQNFKDVKIHGTQMTGKVAKMMNSMRDEDDEMEEESMETSSGENDCSIKDNLLIMGFSSTMVARAMKDCSSRDLGDLVSYITSLPEETAETAMEETIEHSEVVCDGDQCRLVTHPEPSKSLDERIENAKKEIERRKVEKEEEEKQNAFQLEKERIERSKKMQGTKEEIDRSQRQREMEKQRQEKFAAAQEKKRQLELWRVEHGLPLVQKEKQQEKTPEERAKLLAESVALHRVDNTGTTALRTLQTIISNTEKDDIKFRQLRKDNGALQKRVVAVPGALPLMILAGFEDEGDMYVMKERDASRVAMVLETIRRMIYSCLLKSKVIERRCS